MSILLLSLTMASGCGPANTGTPQGIGEGDVKLVQDLVGSIADKSANSRDFGELFADDAVPKDSDRQNLAKYFVKIAEETGLVITGDTATIQISFAKYSEVEEDNETVLTWEAQKVDEETWEFTKAEFPK